MDDESFDLDLDEPGQDSVISTEPIVVTTYSGYARSVLHNAEMTAALAPGGTMTSEHLLLSLVQHPTCAAAQVLAGCGFDAQRIGQTIGFIQGPQPVAESSAVVVLSPRMERVLLTAGHEAAIQNSESIDTLHLLVAVLREQQGIAAMALEAPGVGYELVGAAISQAMRNGMTDQS